MAVISIKSLSAVTVSPADLSVTNSPVLSFWSLYEILPHPLHATTSEAIISSKTFVSYSNFPDIAPIPFSTSIPLSLIKNVIVVPCSISADVTSFNVILTLKLAAKLTVINAIIMIPAIISETIPFFICFFPSFLIINIALVYNIIKIKSTFFYFFLYLIFSN